MSRVYGTVMFIKLGAAASVALASVCTAGGWWAWPVRILQHMSAAAAALALEASAVEVAV